MNDAILVINSGSSTLKFSLYSTESLSVSFCKGSIDNILDSPVLTLSDVRTSRQIHLRLETSGHAAGLQALFQQLESLPEKITLKAAGHRIVHGGVEFTQSVLVTDDNLKHMDSLNRLAPLHQPHNLEAIRVIRGLYPDLPQIACFDTTFHRTQQRLAMLFGLPRALTDEGILRYGFHGISYEYIASVLTQHIGEVGNQRVIVAHLGNGASMCAMFERKSVATSMGFTALDGLMMGTRCGRIDPGVLLYLLQEKKWSATKISHLLYNESGMLGVSGLSHDMRTLLASHDPTAREAIDLFCYRAAQEAGMLTASLNGCDALVFTAGIGEHSDVIREKICERLTWLGIRLDPEANRRHATIISDRQSMTVSVIPTDEERVIAGHTMSILSSASQTARPLA